MAFGKYTNDYNIRSKASSLSSTDEGLRKFMLKVYSYMTAGLAVTGVVSYLLVNSIKVGNPIGIMLVTPPLVYLFMFAPLGLIFWMGMGINKMSARTAQNVFWIFSLLYGVSLSTLLVNYTGISITRVFLICSSMFLAMTTWGYTTKRSLVGLSSFLTMGVFGLIIASIVNIFLQSPMMYFLISFIGVLVFAGLTATDTQAIKEIYVENENSENATKKAVMGALKLYLDFLLMFQYLLILFGNRE